MSARSPRAAHPSTSSSAGASPSPAAPVAAPTGPSAGSSVGLLQDVLGYRVATARVATQELFARHIGRASGLKPVEFSLLMLVRAHPAVTPKQLSRLLAMSSPHLTLLLDRLQERGLIQREKSAVDRRSQHVLLTDAGERLSAEMAALVPAMEAELAESLTPGERAILLELLEKVARHRRDGTAEAGGEAAVEPD